MTKRLAIFALVAMTFAAAPQALKAADDGLCPLGNATIRGTHMTQGTGSIVGVGPIAVVGVMTYDGTGSCVLASTVKPERRDF